MVLDVVGELVRDLLPVRTDRGLETGEHVKRLRRFHLHLVVNVQWMCLVVWLCATNGDAYSSFIATNIQDVDTLVNGGIQHLEHAWQVDALEAFGRGRRHCGKCVFVLTLGELTIG